MALLLALVWTLSLCACNGSETRGDTFDGSDLLVPTRLPQRSLDQLLEVMRDHPAERDVAAARAEAVERVFAADGTSVLYDLVSKKRAVDDRSLFGLTREERYLSENLRLVMVDIGSPRSLHALRPDIMGQLDVSPMLARAATRLDADDRQRDERLREIVQRINQQMRAGLPTACARLLRELDLFLAAHPSRVIPLRIESHNVPDEALTIEARSRETLQRALADAFRELPGLAPARTIPGRRVRLSLTPVLTLDALLLVVRDLDDLHVVHAGRMTWAEAAGGRVPDAVAHTLARIDAVRRAVRELPLVLHRAPPPSLVPVRTEPLGLAVMPFAATDEAVEITRAIRWQILASLSEHRDFRVTDAGLISPIQPANTRPEADEPALALAREQGASLLVTGSVQGRWVRSRFDGELVVRVIDPARDSAVVWESRPWDASPTPADDAGADPPSPSAPGDKEVE